MSSVNQAWVMSKGLAPAMRGESGVIGQDEENNDELTAIAFPRIAGAKPFDITQAWFTDLMAELGQKVEPAEVAPEH